MAKDKALKDNEIREEQLPHFSKLVDNDGVVLGKVRRGNVYKKRKLVGSFYAETGKVYYTPLDRSGNPTGRGYVDKNGNVLECNTNRYMATLRNAKAIVWLPVVLSFLFLTLASILIGAWYISEFNDYIPTFFVADESGISWEDQEDLNIFKNERYDDRKIHPGMTGEYNFRLKNKNEKTLVYSLLFVDDGEGDNPYDMNMVYRLRENGKFIAGNELTWVSAERLSFTQATLDTGSSTTYTLEWKWAHEDFQDTEAGMGRATYTLHIKFSAKILTQFIKNN